ncbi:fused MFS/spermidine synthase [Candidatus Woesearchaeota archaeon]|nr:fused MFS/spermidine synthase [Candidatus Woesearchaeota archaeon]
MRTGTQASRTLLLLAAGTLGLSAMITQLLVIREAISLAAGNELVIGVLLASWLLLSGGGALIGKAVGHRTPSGRLLVGLQGAMAVLPLFTLVMMRLLRSGLFLPGEGIAIQAVLAGSLLLLLPYCLLSGFLLVYITAALGARTGSAAAVYAADATGNLAGGLLFSFLLVLVLTPFQTALVVIAANIVVAALVAARVRAFASLAAVLAVALVAGLMVVGSDIERFTLGTLYYGQEVVSSVSTPYGSIMVTEAGGQLNLFESGAHLFSTGSTYAAESMVHPAMVQRERPERVLILSGGAGGAVREIEKYRSVMRIDYVELDPTVIWIAEERTTNLDSPLLSSRGEDPRLFLSDRAAAGERYDVIMVGGGEPSTFQANRLFTDEFYTEATAALADGGVLAFALPGGADYQGEETRMLHASVFRTLSRHFAHVLVLPGEEFRYLASDLPLSSDIGGLVERRGVSTEYVHSGFLAAEYSDERIAAVRAEVDVPARINRDLAPSSYRYAISLWIARSGSVVWVLAAFAAVLLGGILIVRTSVPALAVLSTGFASMVQQVALLMAFQARFGYLYYALGVMVTVFMAGVAAGSLLARRLPARSGRSALLVSEPLAVLVVLLTLAVVQSDALILYGIVSLLMGALVGCQFALANAAAGAGERGSAAASRAWLADSVGAAAGALLASVFLVPLLGAVPTLGAVALLKAASGLYAWKKG